MTWQPIPNPITLLSRPSSTNIFAFLLLIFNLRCASLSVVQAAWFICLECPPGTPKAARTMRARLCEATSPRHLRAHIGLVLRFPLTPALALLPPLPLTTPPPQFSRWPIAPWLRAFRLDELLVLIFHAEMIELRGEIDPFLNHREEFQTRYEGRTKGKLAEDLQMFRSKEFRFVGGWARPCWICWYIPFLCLLLHHSLPLSLSVHLELHSRSTSIIRPWVPILPANRHTQNR